MLYYSPQQFRNGFEFSILAKQKKSVRQNPTELWETDR